MYVELRNINKHFGHFQASRDVSFEIGHGTLAALLGPTMAGLVFDRTGSYFGPILFSMAAALVAGFLTLRLQRK